MIYMFANCEIELLFILFQVKRPDGYNCIGGTLFTGREWGSLSADRPSSERRQGKRRNLNNPADKQQLCYSARLSSPHRHPSLRHPFSTSNTKGCLRSLPTTPCHSQFPSANCDTQRAYDGRSRCGWRELDEPNFRGLCPHSRSTWPYFQEWVDHRTSSLIIIYWS